MLDSAGEGSDIIQPSILGKLNCYVVPKAVTISERRQGMEENVEGMISPYRVLDLTDEKGLLCGKLLGDLGADVIKVEKPGGDPSRNIGPFYHDESHPEKSLLWFAYNTSKRDITLDIEKADGQEILKRLVKTADFIIESFPPGYVDGLGLGYRELEKINHRIIMVSITPFGQTGPYKDYKAPDIVAWALGGYMYPFGDADRPPVRIGHYSQAYLHAAGEAALAAMMALYYRELTGEGQHVDVSIQESVCWILDLIIAGWDMLNLIQRRGRGQPTSNHPDVRTRLIWPSKDGYVFWRWPFGPKSTSRIVPFLQWMESEGMADDFLTTFGWEECDSRQLTKELVKRIEEPTYKFFLEHTNAELFEGGVKRRLMLYPVQNVAEVAESAQLAAREFWMDVEHRELGTTITYPGPFARSTATPPRISRRAPLVGEHNREVYEQELGVSRQELERLRQNKVI